jgi:DNA-binding MurR/RpiR family transcriptional regulator
MSGDVAIRAVSTFDVVTPNPRLADLRARIREHSDGLARAAQRVCHVLTELTPEELVYMTAAELGRRTRTSNATVVRTLQALGYEGLADLKATIVGGGPAEVVPAVKARRRVESTGRDLDAVWDLVTAEAIERITLLRQSHSADKFDEAIRLLLGAKTVFTYGFGATGIVAEHLAQQVRRVGLLSRRIRGSGFQLADEMLSLERDSAIVLFVPGRYPREVEVLLDRCHTLGVSTILITHELTDRLRDIVTLVIEAPNTSTGLSAEALSPLIVADALAQGLAALDAERTVQSSHTLGTIRRQLGY